MTLPQGWFASDGEADWHPSDVTLRRSRVRELMERHNVRDLPELHDRAVRDPEWYWRAVVDHLDVAFQRPFTRVLDESAGKQFPRWFRDGAINVTHNCLDRYVDKTYEDKAAVVWETESGDSRSTTYRELLEEVTRFARYLRSVGIREGDRVGLFVPMVPETAAAFLACARVGAIVVPAFSGYGPDALAARLQACDVSLLVTADGFRRKGKIVAMMPVVERALKDSPSVRRVVVISNVGLSVDETLLSTSWTDALAAGDSSDASGECAVLDPNHALMIMYTSGTTGKPKGIVLSHGGFLAKAGSDFAYSFDIRDDDVMLWITDMGWLMGPLLIVSGLMFHATVVFYEGVPDHPTAGRIWEVIERHAVTFFGVSPTAVRTLAAAGDQWVGQRLDALRAFASTGEPWNPGPWRWLFEVVGRKKLPIFNYSGGTEVGGGILTCYPVLPLKACAFSGPVIGMDARVADEAGHSGEGQAGQLVVGNTWPGMTHGFWQDPQRYLETYWSEIPGSWVHGDLVVRDEDGYWYVTGRSDDTIKISGKRVGPVEVESAAMAHPAVAEAAVVGIPNDMKGQALICFVVLVAGAPRGEETESEIKATVTDRLGKSLVPERVYFVSKLPKTRNGKIVRRVIRAKHLSLEPGDLSSLEDVESLELIPVMDRS